MSSGRRPKPTLLRQLEGNLGKRSFNEHEPKPIPEIPACPIRLGKHAQAEWDRITVALHRLNLLTGVDATALASYCIQWGRVVELEGRILLYGQFVQLPNGNLVTSPLVTQSDDAQRLMHKFMTEFGLTPASRSRIAAEPADTMVGDAAEDWFTRRANMHVA